jgi:hypothetical protein
MVIKLYADGCRFAERRDNDQLFQLQGGGPHFFTEAIQIIPIRTSNPLDQAMQEEALQDPGDLQKSIGCGPNPFLWKNKPKSLPHLILWSFNLLGSGYAGLRV